MKNPPSDESTSDTQEKVSVKDILQSVFAAALGVQSSKNRDRDFKQGNIGIFIAAGILFTALFIGGVIAVVQAVVSHN
jgi:K+-sensing histidine kinase KdpD